MEFGIQETFAHGIRNPENTCLWNPEYRKQLHVESGIAIFGNRNPGKQAFWNLESTPVPGIWSPHQGVQSPEVSRITLHVANYYILSLLIN